jgi:membrane protein
VTYAASCAFYSFLSLFPMAALAASLVPCIGVSEAALLRFLGTVAPVGVAALLQAILSNVYENVFPALPLSLLALLWSAAQAFSELLKGMTAMTDPARQAGFLKRRLRAILLTMALLMMLLLSLSVLIFGARLALFIGYLFPQVRGLMALFLRLRHLFMGALLWLLFVFLYRSIPDQRFSFREVRTGAALSTVAWIAFSGLFSLYAALFFDLSLYGGMAAMALTMLWLFYCQYIVLVGAGVCARQRSKKEAPRLATAS